MKTTIEERRTMKKWNWPRAVILGCAVTAVVGAAFLPELALQQNSKDLPMYVLVRAVPTASPGSPESPVVMMQVYMDQLYMEDGVRYVRQDGGDVYKVCDQNETEAMVDYYIMKEVKMNEYERSQYVE